jgi:hypothetical protein
MTRAQPTASLSTIIEGGHDEGHAHTVIVTAERGPYGPYARRSKFIRESRGNVSVMGVWRDGLVEKAVASGKKGEELIAHLVMGFPGDVKIIERYQDSRPANLFGEAAITIFGEENEVATQMNYNKDGIHNNLPEGSFAGEQFNEAGQLITIYSIPSGDEVPMVVVDLNESGPVSMSGRELTAPESLRLRTVLAEVNEGRVYGPAGKFGKRAAAPKA